MTRRTYRLLGGVAIAALTACAPGGLPVGTNLALGRLEAAGSLRVELRALQAIAADVDRVVVSAAGPGAPLEQIVLAAALADGSEAVALADLSPGTYQLTVRAEAADGRALGQWTGPAVVAAGAATPVDATVALGDAPGALRVLVGPPSGGQTGLTADVAFVEPAPMKRAAVAQQYLTGLPGKDAHSLAVQADGSVWVVGGPGWGVRQEPSNVLTPLGKLYRIGPDGVLADRTPAAPAHEPSGRFDLGYLAAAPGGDGFLLSSANSQGKSAAALAFGADGLPRASFAPTTQDRAALAADGAVWSARRGAGSSWLVERQVAGVATQTVATLTDSVVDSLVADATGHVWVHARNFEPKTSTLRRYDAAGAGSTAQAQVRFQSGWFQSAACAPDGHLWALDVEDRVLQKVAPDGTIARTVPAVEAYNSLHVDGRGHVWLYQATSTLTIANGDLAPSMPARPIAELAPDGTVLAFHAVAEDLGISDLAVAADGTLWLATVHTGVLKVTLDAP